MKIEKKENVFHIDGDITEFSEFGELQSEETAIEVNLGKVLRLNSMGIRKYLKFIIDLAPKSLILHEIRPDFVNNINVIPQMLGAAGSRSKVISLYLPYFCEECKSETEVLNKVSELDFNGEGEPSLSQPNCPMCEQVLESDFPEIEYFSFLDREY